MNTGSNLIKHRVLFILGLVLAGEAIFALPFHVARFFRPIVLEVFNLSATELGFAQGVYGVVAMLAYFPGGILADHFAANKLMAFSLWSTAAGGLYMTTFPPYQGTLILFGFFGITTIMLFWSALIRATRDWGGTDEQGQAFGILESGRGLLAAFLAWLGVVVFELSFPNGYEVATFDEKINALRFVINGYILVTAIIGIYIWFALNEQTTNSSINTLRAGTLLNTSHLSLHIKNVLRIPAVWLQALIVICAYIGFKGFDNYSLYAVEVHNFDEIEAAKIITIGSWVRPVAALGAGLLADRYKAINMLIICFILLLISDLFFAFTTPEVMTIYIFFANIFLTCIAIFALRGLYFAVFEENKIPAKLTGTAVGLVSVIGFTPDIFVLFVAGVLIDQSPGITGHQHFMVFLACFAFIGLLASTALSYKVKNLAHSIINR